ncbi:hypothetical protein BB561_000644 [Smittium simulii]|uniref:Cytosol aminopeptidase domain-containing protein n=1 Tax=Smittium simulii TaxID=133385 RepID=A0A2T9YY98_9FUNG|nr:hypothetical protein BB561_000644 [Smittium simulii]
MNVNKGVIIGIFDDLQFSSPNAFVATALKCSQESILTQLNALNFKGKVGDTYCSFDSIDSFGSTQVIIVGVGKSNEEEDIKTENIRLATANGVRGLIEKKVTDIKVDILSNPQAAAEGAYLSIYKYDATKNDKNTPVSLFPYSVQTNDGFLSDCELTAWNVGKVFAESQNWARTLATTPANFMTPTIFGNEVLRELSQFDNVQVNLHDRAWAAQHKMGLFLGVTNGSLEPPCFAEIIYTGPCDHEVPTALVGKGVTFDSGGISLKPSKNMDLMKADMGGAAAVVSAIRGIAALKVPIYAVACIPLCENLPSGCATKPGDVHRGMNGKTVEILNTDAEGRLILADALTYVVDTYNPSTVIDVATLTGAMVVALGEVYTGVFTSSNKLWERLHAASRKSGDGFWRMPLHSTYLKSMESKIADIANISNSSGAGSASAAMFLREFLGSNKKIDINEQNADRASEDGPKWAHMDIAGTMETSNTTSYNVNSLTGRPTRGLIEFMQSVSKTPL